VVLSHPAAGRTVGRRCVSRSSMLSQMEARVRIRVYLCFGTVRTGSLELCPQFHVISKTWMTLIQKQKITWRMRRDMLYYQWAIASLAVRPQVTSKEANNVS